MIKKCELCRLEFTPDFESQRYCDIGCIHFKLKGLTLEGVDKKEDKYWQKWGYPQLKSPR